MDERISSTMTLVQETDELLRLVKNIAARARDLAAQWAERRLFEPKEGQVRSFVQSLPRTLHEGSKQCC